MTSRQSKKPTLNELMREIPQSPAEWTAVWDDVVAHSDRGSVIVAATIVEDMLKSAIAKHLDLPGEDFEKMFGLTH